MPSFNFELCDWLYNSVDLDISFLQFRADAVLAHWEADLWKKILVLQISIKNKKGEYRSALQHIILFSF